ncbi:MAG: hypothetical protein RIM84_00005, partial [Alphaproteobacteria bacterium]
MTRRAPLLGTSLRSHVLRRSALCLVLAAPAPAAMAQGTVVIGGDGAAGVEVDMQAIGGGSGTGRTYVGRDGRLLAPVYGLGSPNDRQLLIPGERRADTGCVQLRPPGGGSAPRLNAPALAARPAPAPDRG